MKVLITGGAGFIGSAVAKHFVELGHEVIVADRFTYSGKARNLGPVLKHVRLLIGDLAHGDLAVRCAETAPDYVVHLAAETHVDRAIASPELFAVSNVLGTSKLLQALYAHAQAAIARYTAGESDRCVLPMPQKIIVYSTDEVYGPTPAGVLFDEHAPFKPSNAYSASKVGVEGLASSFFVTHGMPIVVVRPCNTFGPGQHPEKAIPRFVGQALAGEAITLYNDGQGSRDWLHTADHARAIEALCLHGVPGEAYNLAAGEEHTDLDIATRIIELVSGQPVGIDPSTLPLTYRPGRPGHDRRYAMDGAKLRALGWQPEVPFEVGFADTVRWNMANADWWANDLVEVA